MANDCDEETKAREALDEFAQEYGLRVRLTEADPGPCNLVLATVMVMKQIVDKMARIEGIAAQQMIDGEPVPAVCYLCLRRIHEHLILTATDLIYAQGDIRVISSHAARISGAGDGNGELH